MANSKADPSSHHSGAARNHSFFRLISLLVLIALLLVTAVLLWTTRDAMAHLSFLRNRGQGSSSTATLVDISPWQTAEALAPLAVSAEENELAREAEHLADHEVDQAFSAALRQAHLDAQHLTLTGQALALKQKIAGLDQLRLQDQAQVNSLTAAKGNANADDDDALQAAKAQLGLDTDELDELQHDFDRASGDNSSRIQDELNAHEQAMRKYDSEVASGQTAVISMARNHTLASRIQAWINQRQRYKLIEQARGQALNDVKIITAQHDAIEARANSAPALSTVSDQSDRIWRIKNRSIEREIQSIDDDRIQTGQQLADIYAKWSAQVLLLHRIVFHLMLNSLLTIILILIAMLVCGAIVRRLMVRFTRNRRQMHTLRSVIELGIQVIGGALILLVIFGAPQQTPTILGLATAALTIALQDYIVAFLGWFTLMGKNGIHVGDWVEINGVGGEVVELKLMTTTLLETGGLAEQGHPTGRRITFMNSYAIRGQFFNFSTVGQWLWEEIAINIPAGLDIHTVAHKIEELAEEETRENVHLAEKEWRQLGRGEHLTRFSAAPVVNLRPSGTGIDLQLRYVTAAEERFALRNRLYQRMVDLLQEAEVSKKPPEAH